ncbi:putative ras [Staphylotrichum tortipilum]|uniref:Ras n=1 Tax=Staphylotrichum tortipilum TaxID=2831512 RepID=A0AAN6MGU3_9PEZI|nr:putative ras [Staphylotrichum longicolle]
MATPTTPFRTLYRSLLRELPPRPLLTTPRAPLHQRLRETFQQPTLSTSPVQSQSQQPQQQTVWQAQQAEQYAAYLRAQRTYVTLIERYNPGMGMDEEERVRLTARRVGMDLPVEYEEQEGGKL